MQSFNRVIRIFKYNLIRYISRLILGRFFGFSIALYDNKKGYYILGNSGTWWRRKEGFGNKYNTNYELAIEVKPGPVQIKIWLNGKLMDKTDSTAFKIEPYIYFGTEPTLYYRPQFYLNDIFCINKSEFLPDQYTVNWREPWYELMHKHIYTHHDEAFYSK